MPKTLHERLSCGAVDAEGFRLPSRAVEREHPLTPQALSQRVLRDEDLELGGEHGMPSERELRVDPVLERRESQLLEPLGGRACE